MKRKVGLLISSILLYLISFSQYRNYKTDSGWNLGFNTGGTWQQKEAIVNGSDTALTLPFTSIRGGFTLGKSLYEKEGSLLSFDLRFRYLRGINYGWANHMDTISATLFSNQVNDIKAYKNYKMDLNEFSLEGVLTLNKLLEETGVILYGFGGIGLIDYRVKTDYLDGYSQYTYPDLTNQSNRNAARLLKDNSDLEFESNAPGVLGNQLKFMPSLGIGLGYQFNETFSMGLEHKITYAFHNNLDGIASDGLNDRYHYTAIKIGFNISGEGTSSYGSNEMFQDDYYQQTVINNPPPVINNNVSNPPSTSTEPSNNEITTKRPPFVEIINPENNYTDVNNSYYTINAEISEVVGKQNITFLINGIEQPSYLYDYTFNKFTADIKLNLGENEIKIIGENQDGVASDQAVLNYIIPNKANPPSVKITNPSSNPYKTVTENYLITANVKNIINSSQIKFYLNNKISNSFTLSSSGLLKSNASLEEGNNTILIVATNQHGSAKDETTLIYEKVNLISLPAVKITSPIINPYKSETQKTLITADVKNISNPNQIKFYLNNKINNSFTLSSSGVLKSNVFLNEGNNIILIVATNQYGTAKDETTLSYEKRNVGTPPDVVITSPDTNPYKSNKQKFTLKAFTYHVDSKQKISIKLNNNTISNFTFNTITRQLTLNGGLKDGVNSIVISAKNDFGSDSEDIVINYQKPTAIAKPNIIVDFPATTTYTTDKEMILIKGKIYNVSNVNDASSNFNNKPSKYFQFNTGSKRFQATLTLIPGANTFIVNATNVSGSDSKFITIIYNPTECDNPSINRILPQNNSITTTNNKAYIEMQVSNTQNIDFKINGNSSSGFNFDVNTGVFTSMLNLKPGITVYTVSATNDCGTTSETVTYQMNQNITQGQAPNIQINGLNNNSSNNNPIVINSPSSQITGKITNYDSQTKISYYSTPSKMAKLDYILATGNIIGTVFLSQNQVTKLTIVAENKWGKTKKDLYFKQPSKNPNTSSPARGSNETEGSSSTKSPDKQSQEEKEHSAKKEKELERERAAQEARERAAQEARERAAQEARERAAQEARERAAQEARERAEKEKAAQKAAEEKELEKKQEPKKGGGK